MNFGKIFVENVVCRDFGWFSLAALSHHTLCVGTFPISICCVVLSLFCSLSWNCRDYQSQSILVLRVHLVIQDGRACGVVSLRCLLKIPPSASATHKQQSRRNDWNETAVAAKYPPVRLQCGRKSETFLGEVRKAIPSGVGFHIV